MLGMHDLNVIALWFIKGMVIDMYIHADGNWKVNNYIVRWYRNVIVVTNIETRRTSKA